MVAGAVWHAASPATALLGRVVKLPDGALVVVTAPGRAIFLVCSARIALQPGTPIRVRIPGALRATGASLAGTQLPHEHERQGPGSSVACDPSALPLAPFGVHVLQEAVSGPMRCRDWPQGKAPDTFRPLSPGRRMRRGRADDRFTVVASGQRWRLLFHLRPDLSTRSKRSRKDSTPQQEHPSRSCRQNTNIVIATSTSLVFEMIQIVFLSKLLPLNSISCESNTRRSALFAFKWPPQQPRHFSRQAIRVWGILKATHGRAQGRQHLAKWGQT